jgi:hypothetical protein
MESPILSNHNNNQEPMFLHLLEVALEQRIVESEINSQDPETQTFDSDHSLFDSLSQTDNFSDVLPGSRLLRYKKDGIYKLPY